MGSKGKWGLCMLGPVPVFVKYNLIINDIFTISSIEDLLRFENAIEIISKGDLS